MSDMDINEEENYNEGAEVFGDEDNDDDDQADVDLFGATSIQDVLQGRSNSLHAMQSKLIFLQLRLH